ncbi:1-deoxy-D-xylulose-5-phosphate reductoisomerase [Rhodohalobacter sp. 8-1]|uniref:1-deoxy-D-xylulose-5-phosphate reductoisomerase n=1 Tax=Rhodohalobacter sp. 8-1 TaxID=3131972 RepID=UPI0030ED41D4
MLYFTNQQLKSIRPDLIRNFSILTPNMMHTKDSSQLKRIAILGATGSIGTQALEIISDNPESYEVLGLTAHSNWKKLATQANEFRPKRLILSDKSNSQSFEDALLYKPEQIDYGPESLRQMAADPNADLILNALVGFAGFSSTYDALKAGNSVALANKESLVVGGEILTAIPGFHDRLIPVDSEHSAMWQCLVGEDMNTVEKIIITASGGPFRQYSREKMKSITVKDALNHPNWEMGNKITIDSSTMMNKGLEIIEAHWLFGINIELIEPVIHPQSIIHSIVEFKDGSSKAQLGPPDMKVPILYSLSYPDRLPLNVPRLDYKKRMSLTFEPVDFIKFPCVEIAIEAVKEGGIKPAVMNAANEVAVERFLNEEIRYIDIPVLIEKALSKFNQRTITSPQTLFEVDAETRKFANTLFK